LLLVAFLVVTAPNCHLSLVLVSAVQGDAVNCNNTEMYWSAQERWWRGSTRITLRNKCEDSS